VRCVSFVCACVLPSLSDSRAFSLPCSCSLALALVKLLSLARARSLSRALSLQSLSLSLSLSHARSHLFSRVSERALSLYSLSLSLSPSLSPARALSLPPPLPRARAVSLPRLRSLLFSELPEKPSLARSLARFVSLPSPSLLLSLVLSLQPLVFCRFLAERAQSVSLLLAPLSISLCVDKCKSMHAGGLPCAG
jgi:hypothetical protein